MEIIGVLDSGNLFLSAELYLSSQGYLYLMKQRHQLILPPIILSRRLFEMNLETALCALLHIAFLLLSTVILFWYSVMVRTVVSYSSVFYLFFSYTSTGFALSDSIGMLFSPFSYKSRPYNFISWFWVYFLVLLFIGFQVGAIGENVVWGYILTKWKIVKSHMLKSHPDTFFLFNCNFEILVAAKLTLLRGSMALYDSFLCLPFWCITWKQNNSKMCFWIGWLGWLDTISHKVH